MLNFHNNAYLRVNTTGVILQCYNYTAFGNATAEDPTITLNFPQLFHGEYYDNDTGLSNYGYRYYVPKLGRWLSRDPIGETGGLNLYGFVANKPLNTADYLGMSDNKYYNRGNFFCEDWTTVLGSHLIGSFTVNDETSCSEDGYVIGKATSTVEGKVIPATESEVIAPGNSRSFSATFAALCDASNDISSLLTDIAMDSIISIVSEGAYIVVTVSIGGVKSILRFIFVVKPATAQGVITVDCECNKASGIYEKKVKIIQKAIHNDKNLTWNYFDPPRPPYYYYYH